MNFKLKLCNLFKTINLFQFSGIWYEAERYFQLSEVASRCVKSNYTRGPDGKFRVLNEVTSIL